VKHFTIADNNTLSHPGRGDFVLCPLAEGILSEEDFVQGGFCPGGIMSGGFCPFPPPAHSATGTRYAKKSIRRVSP